MTLLPLSSSLSYFSLILLYISFSYNTFSSPFSLLPLFFLHSLFFSPSLSAFFNSSHLPYLSSPHFSSTASFFLLLLFTTLFFHHNQLLLSLFSSFSPHSFSLNPATLPLHFILFLLLLNTLSLTPHLAFFPPPSLTFPSTLCLSFSPAPFLNFSSPCHPSFPPSLFLSFFFLHLLPFTSLFHPILTSLFFPSPHFYTSTLPHISPPHHNFTPLPLHLIFLPPRFICLPLRCLKFSPPPDLTFTPPHLIFLPPCLICPPPHCLKFPLPHLTFPPLPIHPTFLPPPTQISLFPSVTIPRSTSKHYF